MSKRVTVQELVGRRVRDANGKVLGRIEAIRATWRGKECRVVDFELGTAALLDRLGIRAAGLIGWPRGDREPRRIPWEQMDLSDPERPTVRE